MGLDLHPFPKPKPGYEAELSFLFFDLEFHAGGNWFLKMLFFLGGRSRKRMLARLKEISISPYETLGALQVGKSPEADAWAREQYANRSDKSKSEAEFMAEMSGYYVLEILPPCLGFPVYSNWPLGYVARSSFRGQFLHDCVDVIGEETLSCFYANQTAEGLAELGRRLQAAADALMTQHGLTKEDLARQAGEDFETPEMEQLDILMDAADWCEYWSSRGHGMEADY